MASKSQDLRRYTDLTAVFSLLAGRKLTLRDTENWDDANDRYFLDLYKRSKRLKSVLAVCFVQASERYHFWQVFAPGRSGVRILFNRELLFRALSVRPDVRMQPVRYLLLDQARKVEIDQFPFVKRYGFKDEREFRVIYESSDLSKNFDIPIPLRCIESIKLNPWLHPDLFYYVEKVIKSIKGCSSLVVEQSRLINNETWQHAGDKAMTGIREAIKHGKDS